MKRLFRPLRTFVRYPKLVLIAAFSIAVAMAVGILALSAVNTLLLLPPAVPQADRLVTIYSQSPGNSLDAISYPDYLYFHRNNHVFTDMAAAPNSISLSFDDNFYGKSVRVLSRPVSDNYFAVLGIKPLLGGFFSPGDDASGKKLAVMSWNCWKRLGADQNIVGKVITGHTIVGVTPEEFTGAFYGVNGDLFTTLADFDANRLWMDQRGARRLTLTARLAPQVAFPQAEAEMRALAGQLASAYPADDKDQKAVVTRATLLPPDALPNARLASGLLIALATLIVLIACANVANLLTAIAVGRRQEAAIKLALGVSRKRLVLEFLEESGLLCAVGGVLGFLSAYAMLRRFSQVTFVLPMFGSITFGLNMRLDWTVAALTAILAVAATLAAGLPPALYACSAGISQVLGGEMVIGGTRKVARRNALVVSQMAICTLVLVGMGLCERDLYNLRHVDPGFSHRNLLTVTVYTEAEGYKEPQAPGLYERLRNTVSGLPGVESVSLAWFAPLSGSQEVPVQPPGGLKNVLIGHNVADPDYFETLGIRIIQGRAFDSSDRAESPWVAVVNQSMAQTFWPGLQAIGKTFLAGDPAKQVSVIGVAPDGKYDGLDESPRPFFYYALTQHYQGGITAIARTHGDPRGWIEAVAKALRGLGLKILVQPVTLDNWIDLTLFGERLTTECAAVLGGLALILSLVGLFGAVSYSVRERKKELGIRIALGAGAGDLQKLVLRQTSWVAGVGIGIGTVLGVGVTMLLRAQLYGIGAVEWKVLAPVASIMLLFSLGVTYLSARPWLKIDPLEAVRHV